MKERIIEHKWSIIILLLLLVLGASLRVYHLDYPSIGYHNWKETRYDTAARNFYEQGFFRWGFFVPAYDFPKMYVDASGAHSDFFPTSSIAAALMFSIAGVSLWAARFPVMLVSVLTILTMYLVMRKLFKREDIALTTAALVAINPGLTFFSHNVDQMPFGLLFVTLAWWLFLCWKESDKARHLILACAFALLGIITKYTYVISLLPLLAIVPYGRMWAWRLEIKKRLPLFIGCGLILLLAPLWWYYSSFVVTAAYGGGAQGAGAMKIATWSNFFDGLSLNQILKSYFADNYTFVGLLFAFAGFLLFLWMRKKLQPDPRRFTLAFVGSAILMFLIIPESITGHSYHQFPALPIVLILIAYCFTVIAVMVKKYLNYPGVKAAVLILLFFVPIPVFSYAVQDWKDHTLYYSSMSAANRQWDTQFYGLDIAGDYIRTHKDDNDRIMHSGHQAFGVLWHGNIKGTRGIPNNSTWIKDGEDRLNASWFFIYNWDFSLFQDPDRWGYITSTYRPVQLGFMQQQGRPALVYLLLRKGGNFTLESLDQRLQGLPARTVNYETTRGPVPFQYVNLEP